MKEDTSKIYSLPESVKLYRFAEVSESSIGEDSIVGDFSRVRNSTLGVHTRIDRNNFLTNVIMGNYSYTGPFDMIFHCKIGKFVSISYGVTIGAPEHNYHLLSTHPFIYNKGYGLLDDSQLIRNDKFDKPLVIGNDVWIGCNATVLRGVSIGDGAVIGANSLVNKDVPPYAIVAGCPARIIKYRFEKEIIDKLLHMQWWNWDDKTIKEHPELFTSPINQDILTSYL